MRPAITALVSISLLALAPACDSSDADLGDDFRGSFDVNTQMTMADGGSDDGTVIWEIVEAGVVYEGPAQLGNVLMYVEGNAIYDTSGEKTCTIDSPFLHSNMREVVAANGSEVLFTVWNNYVFDGEIHVKSENWGQVKKQFGDKLLFQLEPNDIFLGEAIDGYRLMSTNADITAQSEGRKLLMAALMTGECGSAGLPGYTF
ncbi:hypothetical protein [Enhygromyxa salina]|uniref:Lipoprotein n=1 Tax=Enhygromyxa salina TaxID=215803 RepID=A0A2S9YPH2_9BACT|nr:hypothetical protein [Enhygromyxa salina]PRQ06978.1 hypothetical protein ENSA7_33120 [Enhygromyxa salina]